MSRNNIICVSCPKGCRIQVESREGEIYDISGHSCPVGETYAVKEFTNPTRVLPTTVRVKGGELPLVPVKTAEPIPRKDLLKAMKKIARVEVKAPVAIGQVIIPNLLDTGVDLVATRNVARASSAYSRTA